MSAKRRSELSGYLDRYDKEHSKDSIDTTNSDPNSADAGYTEPVDPNVEDVVPQTDIPPRKSMRNRKQKATAIAVITAIFLTIVYIGIGFGVCAGVPASTEVIANATIDDSSSPFSKEELVNGAVAIREYSFGDHDLDSLNDTIKGMNDEAGTPYAGLEISELWKAPSKYVVGEEEISHLDDVHDVASDMLYPILGTATLSAFLLMVGLQFFGIDVVRRSLLYAGAATISILVILGSWAVVSFDSLFAVFHSLFFANGTWQFPADSLLITMLPENFWIGMAALWFASSVLVSILSILLAIFIGRRRERVRMIAGDVNPGDKDS